MYSYCLTANKQWAKRCPTGASRRELSAPAALCPPHPRPAPVPPPLPPIPRPRRDLAIWRSQVDDLDIYAIGPKFEANAVFPAKTNTEFVEVLNHGHVRMVVWERGAGRTLACGTGACATVVAGEPGSGVGRSSVGGALAGAWRALRFFDPVPSTCRV